MQNQLPIILAIFLSIGAFQGLFLAGIFFTSPRGNRNANRWMGMLLLVLSLLISDYIAGLLGWYQRWPHLISIIFPLWFLMGPLIYGYFRTLTGQPLKLSPRKIFLYGLPLLAVVGISLPFYLKNAAEKLAYLQTPQSESVRLLSVALLCFYTLQIGWHMLQSRRELNTFIKEHAFSRDKIPAHLTWLRSLLLIFTVFLALDILLYFAIHFQYVRFALAPYLSILILSCFTYTVAYLAILKPQKFFPESAPKNIKYERSPMTPENLSVYHDRLKFTLGTEKAFLKRQLSLRSLAEMIDITPHQLSQVINQSFGLSFHDLLNRYRIEEVQQRLTDPRYENYTILAIAADVGFNSRASFYRIFKQFTGQTPSEYIKDNRQPAKTSSH